MVAILQWCSSIGRRMISTYRMPMSMPSPSSSTSTMMLPSSSSSGAPISPASAPILCGRGDKKTRKGKRFKGTYGNSRPKRKEMIQRVKDKNEVPSHPAESATMPVPVKKCPKLW